MMEPTDSPNDKQLPVSSVEFEQLLREHQKRIYYFIRTMVFNADDAHDLLQEVNIVMIRKRASFMAGSNFKAWSFTIARFECLSYLARHKRVQWCTLDSGLLESLADAAEEKADEVDPHAEALSHCRKALPEASQQLLDQRYDQRTPLEEVAHRWQTTEGALKQKLFRIRARLKKCILARLKKRNTPNP